MVRDALALCARLAGEGAAQYDSIDTSNLADHVGTLNVLALAAPLLRRGPHARWAAGRAIGGE